MSTDTTVSGRLTTDFPAVLILVRLGDVDPCPPTTIAIETTYVISANVTAGDYSIVVTSLSTGDPSLFCTTPGNYTLTLTDGPVP